MVEFDREFIKRDEVFQKLHGSLKKAHVVSNHTRRILLKNKHVRDFCEEARHYTILQGPDPIYLHYDIASWLKNNHVLVRIESIGVYDNFMEFESCRLRALHSAEHSDIPNIN